MKSNIEIKVSNKSHFGLAKLALMTTLFLIFSVAGYAQTAVASNSGPICAGEQVNLFETGVGATSWLWSSDGTATFSSATAQNPTAFGAVDGEIFTVVINGGISSANTTVSVLALPTTSAAGPDQVNALMCGLTSTTLAANSPSIGTGQWSIVSGAGGSIVTPTSPTSTFNGTAGITYVLRWTISNAPCVASTDDVTITFQQNPTVSNAGADQVSALMCGLTSTTLAANSPSIGTGQWSIVSGAGGTIVTPTSPTSTFNGTAGITYVLRWTISNAPCVASTDDVTITFQQNPTVSNAGTDQVSALMCGLTSTTLAANSPSIGTGQWSIVSGAGGTIVTPTSPTSTFNGTAGVTYVLRWTISNAPCVASTDDVTITFQQNPTVSNAGADQVSALMCGLTSTTLAANSPSIGTGQWSIISGAGGNVSTPSSPTSTFNGTAGVTYVLRWTISNAPCVASTDDVTITFQQNPTVSNAGADQVSALMCGLTSTTLAANSPSIGTGQWSIVSGAGGTIVTPTSPTSTFNGTAGVTYVLRWTISNAPCVASTDDVTITFQQNPTVSNAGADQVSALMCGLTSTTLAANSPSIGTGQWSIVSGAGGTIVTPTSPTSTFNGTAGVTYVLRWTISNAPCVASTDDVTITFQQNPTVSNAGADQVSALMCGLTSTTLAANSPSIGTGQWSIVSGAGGTIVTPSSPTSTFNGTAGVTYVLRWTISNAPCVASTDDVTITFQQNPTVSAAGADQVSALMCGLTSTTLAANSPSIGTGQWSIVSGAGGTIVTPTSPTSTFNGTAGVTYVLRWTISNAPCVASTDDVTITFQQNPTVSNAGADQVSALMCGLTSTTLAANSPSIGTGQWSIVSGAGGTIVTPTSPTSTFNGTAGVTYVLRWTISNAPCVASTDDVTITFQQNPTVSAAGADQVSALMCGLTSTTLAANSPSIGTGQWSIVSGAGGSIVTPTSPTSTFNGTAGVTYVLRWTISNAPCVASTDDVTITFQQNPTVSAAGADQVSALMCGLTSTTLAANSPSIGTGQWSIVSGAGGNVSTPTSPTSTFNGTAGVTYVLRWTISNAPCVASTDDVTITFLLNPTSNAGSAMTDICQALTSAPLGGSVGGSATGGIWNDGGIGGTFSPFASDLNATWTPPSSYFGTAVLTLTTTGGICGVDSDSKNLTVIQDATLALTSANDNQTVCINTPIVNIRYTVGGSGTGGSVSGLPAGVTGSYSGGTITISGTPSVAGIFDYTVNTTGPCVTPSLGGRITVTPDATISLSSGAGTDNQTICINNAITNVSYTIGGSGTGGTVTGLPTGVNANFSGGTVTISGTPTVSGDFNYTVTATGPCVTPSLNGTISVTPNATISLSSGVGTDNQTLCIYSALTNITYTVGGSGTGGTVSGLPIGVNGSFSGGTVTISGIPSESGIFNYTVNTIGPCVEPSLGGTITVIALPVTTASSNSPVCIGTTLNLSGGPDGMSSYSWSGPNGYSSVLQSPTVSASATSAMAGIYTLITTNSYGCQNNATTSVTVNPLPTPTASNNSPICEGDLLSLTGGQNGMTTYSWTGPNGYISSLQSPIVSSAATLAMEGEYTLNVVNSNGCVNSINTDVVINPLPTATISGSTTVCKDDIFPNITFTGAIGTAPYTFTYRINGGPDQYVTTSVGNSISVPVPTGLSGVYTYSLVSVRDASSTACVNPQSGSATVIINPLPTATISGTTSVCQTDTYPNITFTGAEGTAPYTFIYTINSGSPQTISTTGINTSVTIAVPTEAAGIFTYSLVSVQDASLTACSQNQGGSATVSVNALPTATISGTTEVCQDSPSPNITFTGAAGLAPYTFTYTLNGGGYQTITSSSGSSVNIVVPTGTPGTYSYDLISVQDATSTNCDQVQTGNATVTVNPLPAATISGTTAVCQFDSDPLITFTGSLGTAPYSFTYTVNSGSNQIIVSASGSSVTLPVPTETPGTFTYSLVSVRDNSGTSCSQSTSGSATVVVNPLPVATISGSAEVCQSSASPQILFTGANGTAPYHFTYRINGGSDLTIVTSSGNSVNLPVPTSTAGTFVYELLSVQDESSSSCVQVQSGTATVLINPLPSATISGTTSVCRNDVAPQLTFTGSGGTAPYIFTYSINSGSALTISTLSGNSVTVDAPTGTAGIFNYSLQSVQDASSTACVNAQTGSAVVTVNELPTTSSITGNQTPACNATGQVYSVNLTSGSTYTWIAPDGALITSGLTGPENNSITVDFGAFNGNISVIETNANGCLGAQVDLPITLQGCALDANFSASSSSLCNGSSIVFTDVSTGTTGTTTYAWNFGTGATPATQSGIGPHTVFYSGTGTRTVSLTITDGASDNETKSNYITVNPIPSATIAGATDVCQDDTFPLITFTGSNGTAPYTFTYNINGGADLFVTTVSGNSVTVPAPTGNVGSFTYSLTGVQDASSSACFQSLSSSVLVQVFPLPLATISGWTEVCLNGANPDITFTGSNGTAPYTFTYTLNGGAPQTVVSSGGGIATVSVPTTSVGTFTYELLSIEDNSVTSCVNAQSGIAEVEVNPLPTAIISGTTIVCRNDVPPNITFTGANGTAPYTFIYTINSGTPEFVTTIVGNSVTVPAPTGATGDYVYELVSVQDASFSACLQTASGSSTVTVNPLPTATISGDNEICKDEPSPMVTFTGSNGTSPYTFTYTINNGSAQTVTTSTGNSVSIPVPTGTTGDFAYDLISVRDASTTSCVQAQSGQIVVRVNPVPSALISGSAAICQDAVSPLITFTGSNGTEPYTFTYTINSGSPLTITSSGSNTASISVPTGSPGIFTYALISVQDASSTACSQSQTGSATVIINPLPTASISGTTAVCRDALFPNITFTGSLGTAPYTFTYTINNGGYQTVTSSLAGIANVAVPTGTTGTFVYDLISVQDASNTSCSQIVPGSATITINPLPTASISGTTTVCQFAVSPQITFTGSAGTAPYTFIYTVNSGSNQIVSSDASGIVSVSVPTTSTGTFTYSLVSVEDASSTSCSQTQAGSATIIVNPLPTAIISGSTDVCQNAPSPNLTFTGFSFSGFEPYTFTYRINGGTPLQVTTISGNSVAVPVPTTTAGTYLYELLSVQDASSTACEQSQSGTALVTVNPLPTASIGGSTEVCQFDSSPLISFSGFSGTAPYTFIYRVNAGPLQSVSSVLGNTATVSVPTNQPGSFVYELVSVQDASSTSCSQSQGGNATVIVNTLPQAAISGTTVVCQNDISPEITFTGSNGTAPYTFTYSINNGGNLFATTLSGNSVTVSVPTSSAGTYTYELLSVSDGSVSTCNQAQSGSATITVNPLPTATISGTSSICLGDASPQLTFTGSGGTAPYLFTYSINGGSPQTLSTSSGNSVTLNAPTGTAGVFNYELISVRDASTTDCEQTQGGSAVITVHALPVTSVISGDQSPACFATGEVYSVILTAGSTYSWIIPDGAVITSGVIGPENNSITVNFGSSNGNISVIETNSNGCTGAIVNHAITLQGCALDANFNVSSTSVCDGSSIIFNNISTGTSGSTVYSWNFGTGATPLTSSGAGPHVVTYNGTGQRTVSLTIVDGASDTETRINYITVNPIPDATIGGTTDVCEDDVFPVITFTGINGTAPYTFAYTRDGGLTQYVSTTTGNSVSVPVPTGVPGTFVYDLISVQDASSSACLQLVTGSAVIRVNPLPMATISGSTEVCKDATPPEITFTGSGGTAPYTFTYSINNQAPQSVITTVGNTVSIQVPTGAVGTFSYELVSVMDNSSTACLQSQSGLVEVVVSPLPTATIGGTTIVCRNDISPNVTFTGSGGTAPYTFTYAINSGTPLTVTTIVGNSVTVPVPTTSEGVFTYSLLSVQDMGGTGCMQSQVGSVTITINPLPTATISGTTDVCRDGLSPEITFAGFDGTAPYTFTYTINGGSPLAATTTVGNSISIPVPTGTVGVYEYRLVSVQDNSSTFCSQSQTGIATITVNPLPQASISGTATVCMNSTPPDVTFVGSNGTAPYTITYSINSGTPQTATTISGNAVSVPAPTDVVGSFTYSLISVQDASSTSCIQGTTGSITITVEELPTATISGTTEVCRFGAFPNITFTGANGTSPFTFTYTINGGTAQSISTVSGNSISIPVPTGTAGSFVYELVSVRDAGLNSCEQAQSGSATVSVNPLPEAVISGATTVCRYDSEPSVTFTGSNGTAPYIFTYTINGGPNLQVASAVGNSVSVTAPTDQTGLLTYALVSVRDASSTNCIQAQTGTVEVRVNPLPVATISGSTIVCQNDVSPEVLFTGSNGVAPYIFTYTINGLANLIAVSTGSSISVPVPTTAAGTFEYELVSVQDASSSICYQAQIGSATIVVNPLPTATITGTTAVCRDDSFPELTLTGSGGTAPYTFIYSINGNAPQTISTISGNSISISAPTNIAGTYNYELIEVQDASTTTCVNSQNGLAVITVNQLPPTSEISGNQTPACGASGVSFSVVLTPGSTYSWMVPAGAIITSGVIGPDNNSITVNFGTNNGNVSVIETNINACTGDRVDLPISLQGCALDANFSASNTSVCDGSGITFTDISTGTTGSSTYTWDFGAGSTPSVATGPGPHFIIYNGTGTPTVSLTVLDGAVDVETKINYITINPLPTATISGSTDVCVGEASPYITFTGDDGTSPYIFTYRINGGLPQTVSSLFGDVATVPVPTSSATTYSYELLSVRDASSTTCVQAQSGSADVIVHQLPTATITALSTEVCRDGVSPQITFTGLGGSAPYTFVYTINNGPPQAVATSSGNSVSVNVPTGTVDSYTYELVSVQDNNTSCSQVQTGIVTINVNPLPTATIAGTDIVCRNEAYPNVTFTGSGGTAPYTFTYTINSGTLQTVTTLTGNTVTVAVPTETPGSFTYSLVSVMDSNVNSCEQAQSGSATITVNPLPAAIISGTTTVCRDDTPPEVIFTGFSGIEPYTFTYRLDGGNLQTITSSSGGSAILQAPTGTAGSFNYELISVRDASIATCEQAQTGNVVITVNPLPLAQITGTTIVCMNDPEPTITFTGLNGTAPYTFVYTVNSGPALSITSSSGNSVTVQVPTAAPGIRTYALVSVTDASVTACSQAQSGSATVIINPLPTATISGTIELCQNDVMPDITFTGSGGTAPYTFTYSINGGSPLSITTVIGSSVDISVQTGTAGTFEYELLSVSDASPSVCDQVQSGSAIVTINPQPEATIAGTAFVCRNDATPEVSFTGSGGTAPYTFSYRINGGSIDYVTSSSGNTATLSAPTDVTGIYSYELIGVQDASSTSCYQSQTGFVTITVLELPVANISGTTRVCRDTPYPTITFTGADGTAPYTFTYTINGGNALSVTTTTGNSVTITVPTETAGIFTYELVGVRDMGVTSCYQVQNGEAIITIDEIPVSNAGTGGDACEYDFRLNALPDIGTGTWTMTSGTGSATFFPDSNTPDALVTVSELGTKEFTWTEVNGSCSNFASIEVIFYELPDANAGFGGDECDLDFTLNAVPGLGTGVWSMTSGSGTASFSPGPDVPNPIVTVSEEGLKEFTWTVTNGACVDAESVNVSFSLQPTADPGTGGNSCGLSFGLDAAPSHGTGTWTITGGPGSGTFSPSANSPDAMVTVDAFGTYEFTWTEVNGLCSDNANIEVIFYAIPAANAGNGGEECDLDFSLSAVPGGGAGTWTLASGPGNATFSPDIYQPDALVSVDQYGTYQFRWTEVNAICESEDVIEVIFREIPDIFAGNDTIICLGDDAQLLAIGEGTFSWDNAESLDDANISNPIATPDMLTTYTVTLTDQYGCINSDEVIVEPWVQPIAFAGEDLTLEYIFTAWTEAELALHESGSWETTAGSATFGNPLLPVTLINDLSLGENILKWTVTNGVCPESIDYMTITVNDLVIPTLITPNLDGRNDYFQLRGIETLGITELVIFDRRGTQVYRNTNYDNSWDGVDQKGNQLPEDTYFYTIIPTNGKPFKGYIVIRR